MAGLREDLRLVRMERDILGKPWPSFAKERFAFILAEKACWPVMVMCTVLKVSTSGFYVWLRTAPSLRATRGVQLSSGRRSRGAGEPTAARGSTPT